jgi:hypothetical protein
MGCDPLAVDATCCRLMQLDPGKVAYLVLGHHNRLGRLHAARIEQIGEAIEAVAQPFETAPDFHRLCVGWDRLNGDEDGSLETSSGKPLRLLVLSKPVSR